jgi:hypothetical protein
MGFLFIYAFFVYIVVLAFRAARPRRVNPYFKAVLKTIGFTLFPPVAWFLLSRTALASMVHPKNRAGLNLFAALLTGFALTTFSGLMGVGLGGGHTTLIHVYVFCAWFLVLLGLWIPLLWSAR